MQLSDKPYQFPMPFANAGDKNAIPTTSVVPGAANLEDGFPVETGQPILGGGVPPSRLDMNGILAELSEGLRWQQVGGNYKFDGTYATAIDGYPKDALLVADDDSCLFYSTSENNTNNPNNVSTGWIPVPLTGVTSIAVSGTDVTLTPVQYSKKVIVVTGTLTAQTTLIFPTFPFDYLVIDTTNRGSGPFDLQAQTVGGLATIKLNPGVNYFYVRSSANISHISAEATQSEVELGASSGGKFVTPAKLRFGFAASFAQTGYITFPSWLGGLILQWGRFSAPANTSTAVTFTIEFPTACYVCLADGTNDGEAQENWPGVITSSVTTAGFNSRNSENSGTTGMYLALGR